MKKTFLLTASGLFLAAIASGLLLQETLRHYLVLGLVVPAICLLLLVKSVDVSSRGQRDKADFLAVVILLLFTCSLISWAVGRTINEHHKYVIQLYVSNAVESLDAIKAQTGRYPDQLLEAKLGKLPDFNFSSYHSDGFTFSFRYFDSPETRGYYYEFASNSREWVRICSDCLPD